MGARSLPSLLCDDRWICVYDRPNLGKSDKVAGPITSKQTIRDLHRLLDAAAIGLRG